MGFRGWKRGVFDLPGAPFGADSGDGNGAGKCYQSVALPSFRPPERCYQSVALRLFRHPEKPVSPPVRPRFSVRKMLPICRTSASPRAKIDPKIPQISLGCVPNFPRKDRNLPFSAVGKMLPKCRTSPVSPPKTTYQSVAVGQKSGLFCHFLPKKGHKLPLRAYFVSKATKQNTLLPTQFGIVENHVQHADIQVRNNLL